MMHSNWPRRSPGRRAAVRAVEEGDAQQARQSDRAVEHDEAQPAGTADRQAVELLRVAHTVPELENDGLKRAALQQGLRAPALDSADSPGDIIPCFNQLWSGETRCPVPGASSVAPADSPGDKIPCFNQLWSGETPVPSEPATRAKAAAVPPSELTRYDAHGWINNAPETVPSSRISPMPNCATPILMSSYPSSCPCTCR